MDQDLHLREQQAELDALAVAVYATVNDCLSAYGIPHVIEVTNAKGGTTRIEGSHLFAQRTLHAFLATQQTSEIYQLTGIVEPLAKQYARWIVTQYTPRYRAITAEADLAWIERVAVLAIKRHILTNKYDAYRLGQRAAIANPALVAHLAVIVAYHGMIKESARVVHHIIKDPAQARTLLQQLSEILHQFSPEMPGHVSAAPSVPSIGPSLQEDTQQRE